MNNSEVQQEIIILNRMRYENDKGKGSRISFILSDQRQESNNFDGCPVVDEFYNNTSVFTKIPKEVMLEEVIGIFRPKQSIKSPLKSSLSLVGIETDDGIIDLL